MLFYKITNLCIPGFWVFSAFQVIENIPSNIFQVIVIENLTEGIKNWKVVIIKNQHKFTRNKSCGFYLISFFDKK